ncbi:pilus assembly protein N-terminal domain-containing protein [Ovoidimarina sediminis]|uniref:pilus assembly protein N-terminal domain-containing protein n=1 Tax=Ovoidimarina sediminis TaxID=3079856 RepID=UPI00291468AB|nr:pilus assembly protein N-terminal domain-containing protein [Rhodophyticola sp. MJ-SS7]MDU8946704.1 pilus assembly protein N-terminal domain-containing protein [Rhodophyticola sp. MJ-SS7]
MNTKRLSWIAPAAIVIAMLVNAPAFAASTIGVEESSSKRTVEVTSDGAIVLESDAPFSELSIANPAIADISTLSNNAIYVLGKQPGRTTLMVMHENGTVMSMYEIRVTPDITELSRRLSEVLPGEEIDVLTAKDGLVLTGTVSDPGVISKALELASHYAPGKISNLLSVRVEEKAPEPVATPEVEVVHVDPAVVETQLRALLPAEAISVHNLGGTLVLSGTVSSTDEAQKALQIARLVAGEAQISNLLTVAEEKTCTVRTRRGGELIETNIPCRVDAAARNLGNTRSAEPATMAGQQDDLASSENGASIASPTNSSLAPTSSPLPRQRPSLS